MSTDTFLKHFWYNQSFSRVVGMFQYFFFKTVKKRRKSRDVQVVQGTRAPNPYYLQLSARETDLQL